MNAFGYIRVSTKRQEDGTSLKTQGESISRWCQANEIELQSIFVDKESGATTERDGFQLAIKTALGSQQPVAFVVYKLDRFARNLLDTIETINLLTDSNIRVVFISDGIDSQSNIGKLVLNILISVLASFAEYERTTILNRLKDGREYCKSNNLKYSGKSRYGFTQSKESSTVIENAEETAAIWRARELRHAGETYRAIGDVLLSEGYRPRHGKFWSTSVVYSMCNGYTKRVKLVKSDRTSQVKAKFMEKTDL